MDTLGGALSWLQAGCSVIPVKIDGSKAPISNWKEFQQRKPSVEEIRNWFSAGHPGIGVVTGTISGNLELIEFERAAVEERIQLKMRADLEAAGAGELWRRITGGYTEESPSGGLHILYRVDGPVAGNTKLAQRPTGATEPSMAKASPLIETRGQGGQVVVAPSHGPVHSSGKPWRLLKGSPAEIATVTAEERDLLHAVARAFDEMPPPAPIPDRKPTAVLSAGELTPGDDYNERGSWRELLERNGWQVTYSRGNSTYWTRPGKSTSLGASAVTGGDVGDYMYVFTTSSELPSEQAMSKFRVLAFLEHGGDFATTAAELRRQGYGTDRPLELPGYTGGLEELFAPSQAPAEQPGAAVEVDTPDAQLQTPEDLREADIERRAEEELRKLEARDRARRRLAAKLTGGFNLEDVLIDGTEIDDVEPLPYLLDGVLPEAATTFLVGESGAGKSFVATAIGLAVATGSRALNRKAQPGRVMYIAGEGQIGLRGRIRTWLDYEDRQLRPGDFKFVQASPQLVDERAIEQLRQYVARHDIALVILDTLARSNVGADENSAQDMGVAMAAIDRIRGGNDFCTIMVVHHAGKDGQYRGSTAIKGAMDSMVSVTREKPSAPIVVTVVKQKDGEEGPVGQFVLFDPSGAQSAVLRPFEGYRAEPY